MSRAQELASKRLGLLKEFFGGVALRTFVVSLAVEITNIWLYNSYRALLAPNRKTRVQILKICSHPPERRGNCTEWQRSLIISLLVHLPTFRVNDPPFASENYTHCSRARTFSVLKPLRTLSRVVLSINLITMRSNVENWPAGVTCARSSRDNKVINKPNKSAQPLRWLWALRRHVRISGIFRQPEWSVDECVYSMVIVQETRSLIYTFPPSLSSFNARSKNRFNHTRANVSAETVNSAVLSRRIHFPDRVNDDDRGKRPKIAAESRLDQMETVLTR